MKSLLVLFGLLFSASLFAADECNPDKEDCDSQVVYSTDADCEGDDCEKSE